jgi:hypothetical protein
MNWLIGKKTYITAAALLMMGVSLVMRGFVELGLYCILSAAGFFGLGDRANRHQAQILAVIGDLAQLVTDAKSKAPGIALNDAAKAIGDALSPKSDAAVGAALPSSEDLDRVAEEERVKSATGGPVTVFPTSWTQRATVKVDAAISTSPETH